MPKALGWPKPLDCPKPEVEEEVEAWPKALGWPDPDPNPPLALEAGDAVDGAPGCAGVGIGAGAGVSVAPTPASASSPSSTGLIISEYPSLASRLSTFHAPKLPSESSTQSVGGIQPSFVFSSSPLAAARGSLGLSSSSMEESRGRVKSSTTPSGAVSELLSMEEKGRVGRDVSGSSRTSHPSSAPRRPSRPISVLGILAVKMALEKGGHDLRGAAYRRCGRSGRPKDGEGSERLV